MDAGKKIDPDSSFCASAIGSHSKTTCAGDSGSPYVIKYDNQWYVAGLVSWGRGHCATTTHFTKVDYFYNWIADTIEP